MSIQYDLTRISYSRRGCRLSVGAWQEGDMQRLYVCALLAGADGQRPDNDDPRCGRLFPIILLKDGREIPYTACGTTSCVTLTAEGCSARIVMQKGDILRMQAQGAQVVFAPQLLPHEIAKNRGDGSWEICINPAPKLLFYPVKGSVEVSASFDVLTSTPGATRLVFSPGEDGALDIALHMYRSNALKLARYPEFEACVREVEEEFARYLDTAPALPGCYSEAREKAAYLVWQHIQKFSGGVEAIYMNRGIHRAAFSWQQSYQAMGQFGNPQFAWHLLTSMFHFQDDWGMLPDSINDITENFGGTKPPLQGLAIMFLSEFTDFDFVEMNDYRQLYEGLSRSVYWWLSYRDTDGDGIAQFDAPDESGWDDCSMFAEGYPLAAPDLATYLILGMQALELMARRLGKNYEAEEWKQKADTMLERMLAFFWDGEKFISRINVTHEVVESRSVATFIPLLLGQRLPEDIRTKLTAALMREGEWLTPYGLAGESLTSPRWKDGGWLAGSVLAPPQLLCCLGLRACGEMQAARTIAQRYCDAAVGSDFAMIMSAIDGRDVSESRWGSRYPNRMSWTGLVFLLLGSLFLNE